VSAIGDRVVTLAWLLATLALLLRTDTRRAALPAGLVGVTWALGDLDPALALLHRGAIAHLVLAYPDGRLGGWPARAAVAAAYADGLAAVDGGEAWTAAYAAALPAAAAWRVLAARGRRRRAHAVPLALAAAVGAVLAVGMLTHADVLGTYEAILAAGALAVWWDLRTAVWSRVEVAGLVVDLGRRAQDGVLRQRIADAVGDPSLVLAYVRPAGDPVDESGRAVRLPPPGSGRVVTAVVHQGRRVAVLAHEPVALADPLLLDGVAAAVGLAVSNAALQAEVRERAADIAASTRRQVGAGDAQRRRLGAQLRQRVDPLLHDVAEALEAAGERDLLARLDEVGRRLAGFAETLDPVGLDAGLDRALRALCDQAGVPIALDLDLAGPSLALEVEACAWFVASEALANALKHAGAARISLSARRGRGSLRIELRDDGRGGADPAAGSGLRRLADRVAATGGRLSIRSSASEGTLVVAEIPLRREP
jgi:signal transduction histidine kinase